MFGISNLQNIETSEYRPITLQHISTTVTLSQLQHSKCCFQWHQSTQCGFQLSSTFQHIMSWLTTPTPTNTHTAPSIPPKCVLSISANCVFHLLLLRVFHLFPLSVCSIYCCCSDWVSRDRRHFREKITHRFINTSLLELTLSQNGT